MNPNTGWVGRDQPGGNLRAAREDVADRTAAALGVPLDQIVVVEDVELSGTRLTGHWCPA